MNIEQEESVRILAHYWSTYKPKDIKTHHVFIGDIHGDLNQLLLPLVELGIIQVSNKIKRVYHDDISKLCDVFIPEFVLLRSNVDVYVLGDFIDEGMHSRSVVAMLHELSKHDFIHLVIGNHDANILGRYNEYKNDKLDYKSLRSYWPTLQRESTAYDDVFIVKGKVLIKDSDKFLKAYFKPLFDWYYGLFSQGKLNVCYQLDIDKTKYIISHTLITAKGIAELMENRGRKIDGSRGDDASILEPDDAAKKHISEIMKKDKFMFNYEDINTLFRYSSASYIAANRLLYNRMEKDPWANYSIIGHTPGFEYRQMGVNPHPCRDFTERQSHCQPMRAHDPKKAYIYYFDILASSGYDNDDVSRPDYFYYIDAETAKEFKEKKYAKHDEKENGLFLVSNAQALHLYYNIEKERLVFEAYKGKNKTDGVFRFGE